MKRIWPKVGDVYGRLTLIEHHSSGRYGRKWRARCECGNEIFPTSGSLNSGLSTSCGCRRREILAQAGHDNATHRATIGGYTPEYRAWLGIKARCYHPTMESYKYYGARGIVMCASWLSSFEQFYADVGPKPTSKHSIERINVDGNYEPGNVKWATRKEQARNKRGTKLIMIDGVAKTQAEWCEEYSLPPTTFYNRLKLGWTGQDLLRQERHIRRLANHGDEFGGEE